MTNKTVLSDEQHQDDIAVDLFADAMKAKLAKKRIEGRSGWQSMSAEDLSKLLHQHIAKGDPLDVANIAMMLHQNGQALLQSPEIQQALADTKRLDFLADKDQAVANVLLPIDVVINNMGDMRAAIDEVMEAKP